jgi:hypothetical protein
VKVVSCIVSVSMGKGQVGGEVERRGRGRPSNRGGSV